MDLSQDLCLPLASGADFWYWLGGRPAFDFVNTHRERWWRNVETLVTAEDLCTWLLQAGLLDVPAVASAAHLRAARRLRNAIDTGILSAIDSTPMPQQALREVNRWLITGVPTRELVSDGDTLRLGFRAAADPLHHAMHLIAADAAAVLGGADRSRARVCASETCSARFFDASRAGTRRWCSMSACGNTAKARRHRSRLPPKP